MLRQHFTVLLVLPISVIAVQDLTVCERGKYGEHCNVTCPRNCDFVPPRNLQYCDRDTGKCSEGCQRGWHGDLCGQECSRNCLNKTCNQQTGHCTLGCNTDNAGVFCNDTQAATVQDMPVCERGKYGEHCNMTCPRNCGLVPPSYLQYCDRDTGKCSEGCRRGWHGDLCGQECSKECVNKTCNQQTGQCTSGCSGTNMGVFCNGTQDVDINDEDEDEASNLASVLVPVILLGVVLVLVLVGVCWFVSQKPKLFSSFPWRRSTNSSHRSSGSEGNMHPVKGELSRQGELHHHVKCNVTVNCSIP